MRFYRVGNIHNDNQGLWYKAGGSFSGEIHNKHNCLQSSSLQMPYDENVVGYLSVTKTLEELQGWFSKKDIEYLRPFGYSILEYESDDYKEYNNHWLIRQDASKMIREIEISKVVDI